MSKWIYYNHALKPDLAPSREKNTVSSALGSQTDSAQVTTETTGSCWIMDSVIL